MTEPTTSPSLALAQLESILGTLAHDLAASRPLALPIYPRPRSRLRSLQGVGPAGGGGGGAGGQPQANPRAHKFVFPGASAAEAWRFAVMLKILEHVHQALVDGVVLTKRHIYYQDPQLFGKQSVVDKYVDDIAYTFGLQRSALNVVAAPRGLVLGCFTITRAEGGAVVSGDAEAEGMLVPSLHAGDRLDVSDVSWILVIEKEATFRALAQLRVFASSSKKGVLITAKGYPDRATRVFLHALATADPCVPVYALADYDPDGLAIVATYAFGSLALAHEAAALCTPGLEWLGVKSEDVVPLGFGSGGGASNDRASLSASSSSSSDEDTGLLRLSERDRAKARAMLERDSAGGSVAKAQWWRELRVMLMLNVKAEIQALDRGEGLEAWVARKLRL